jgi:hypothetical protein
MRASFSLRDGIQQHIGDYVNCPKAAVSLAAQRQAMAQNHYESYEN